MPPLFIETSHASLHFCHVLSIIRIFSFICAVVIPLSLFSPYIYAQIKSHKKVLISSRGCGAADWLNWSGNTVGIFEWQLAPLRLSTFLTLQHHFPGVSFSWPPCVLILISFQIVWLKLQPHFYNGLKKNEYLLVRWRLVSTLLRRFRAPKTETFGNTSGLKTPGVAL